jgi:putative acetyltransferase
MTIRKATQDDKVEINALHIASIRELCSAHYPAATIDAWVGGREPEIYTHVIATRDVVVVDQDGTLTGFGQLDRQSGEVDAVYVLPSYARQGVGRRILQELERIAAEAGVLRLHVSSSLNAIPFYASAGFLEQCRSVYRLHNNTELACAQMIKPLDDEGDAR